MCEHVCEVAIHVVKFKQILSSTDFYTEINYFHENRHDIGG